jgi:quinoprotein glucose dehydrogenase
MMKWGHVLGVCCLLAGCDTDFDAYLATTGGEPRATSEWSAYGGPGGRKFAALEYITRDNVDGLQLTWAYRTGDVEDVFQNTPVLSEGRLLFCTPFNNVVALDPLTGAELWAFDPQVDRSLRPANEFNCRSVTPARTDDAECPARVFTATNDGRLMALNTITGKPCRTFGNDGEVALDTDVGSINWAGEYQVTSPPVVAGELVIVGSAISDGGRVTAPSGVVRAYHAVSGEQVWAFDLTHSRSAARVMPWVHPTCGHPWWWTPCAIWCFCPPVIRRRIMTARRASTWLTTGLRWWRYAHPPGRCCGILIP